MSGKYAAHVPPRQYVSTKDGADAVRQAIREAEGILCINDSDHTNDIREFSQIAQQEIKKRLA